MSGGPLPRHPSDLTFEARGFRARLSALCAQEGVARAWTDPVGFDEAIQKAPRIPGGRTDNRLLVLPDDSLRVRVRPNHHGGLLGRLGRDRFISPHRVEGEFALWRALEERKAPVPSVVFAISRRKGLFWRSFLGTVDHPEAVTLASWLRSHPEPPFVAEKDPFTQVARRVARAIRRFHDCGAVHGDLHPGNLLLDPEPTEDAAADVRVRLVDLDRAQWRGAIGPAERLRDLMRLRRGLEKEGAAVDLRLQSVFWSAYCDGDRTLRKAMRRHLPRELRRNQRHRLGWRLTGRRATPLPRRRSKTERRRLLSTGMALLLTLGSHLLGCDPAPEADAAAGPGTDAPRRRSLLVTGDTGSRRPFPDWLEGQRAVSHAMTAEDRAHPVDGLILLGDNFYNDGLQRSDLVERIRENLVEPYCHFLALGGPRTNEIGSECFESRKRPNPVPIYAVLGNHDLESPESAALQREVVPAFLPGWHMSGGLAETIELGEGLSLILFESELAIDDERAMKQALGEAIDAAEGPWRILAMHRPIATDDLGRVPVGGYPVWVREAIAASGKAVQLALAGHHHSLQVFALEVPSTLVQVGAGSGSRAKPPLASAEAGSVFGRMQLGFARVDLVGEADRARLVVTLIGTPNWPFLSGIQARETLARFEVDASGRLRAVSRASSSRDSDAN